MRRWSKTFEMSTVPDDILASEYARRANARRQTFAGGRPPETKRCPCGEFTAARAKSRGHKCKKGDA